MELVEINKSKKKWTKRGSNSLHSELPRVPVARLVRLPELALEKERG